MSDTTDEKQKPWLFQKGESGNPNGRPKGTFSIKTRIIERLESNPEELEKMVQVLISDYPALVLQMIDGRPSQSREQESRELPIPIMSLVRFLG